MGKSRSFILEPKNIIRSIRYICLIFVIAIGFISITATGGGGSENYKENPAPYSISGKITDSTGAGIPDVTINLSSSTTKTITTDSNGNYTLTGITNGNYLLIPSKADYTFTPSDIAVTVNNAAVTGQNFTGIIPIAFYSISGKITDLTGAGIPDVTITLSSSTTKTITTDSNGNYTLTGISNGNYLITPSKADYVFIPSSIAVTVNNSVITGQNFAGIISIAFYSISGEITDSTGMGIPDVTITLTNSTAKTITTGSNGDYSLTGIASGNYRLIPSKADYIFIPSSIAVTVNNAAITGQNFTGITTYNNMDCEIWTLAQTSRVLRDNASVGTMEVYLSAARNEWESFQILLRSSKDIMQIDVIPGDLKEDGGYDISANTANLYRQHQIQLVRGSPGNTEFVSGWYPDALIPFRNPRTGEPLTGARFLAAPFDLPANETHGFLVDLHVPRDAKPGVYRGVYKLQDSSGNDAQIQVSLTVYDFTLPDTPEIKTVFGNPMTSLQTYYIDKGRSGVVNDTQQWNAVCGQVFDLLSQNHISAQPDVDPGPTRVGASYVISEEEIAALTQMIDQYHLNAVEAYHPRFYIAGMMTDYNTAISKKAAIDPVITPEDEADLTAWLAEWHEALLDLDRPDVEFYIYLFDEPNDVSAYNYIQKWGKAIVDIQKGWKSSDGSSTILKVLVTEQTKTSNAGWGDLYGAVDIWVPLFPLYDRLTAVERQLLGESLWSYTALVQLTQTPTPWWETDFPLLNYRVASWISWVDQIKGLLYWNMFYWANVDDPWMESETYGTEWVYNGEGLFLYPAQDVGYDGFVPSLRLKALRDSIEDYEYMSILERAGYRQEASSIVNSLVSSWTDWAKDPKAYEAAREELAHLIEQHQLSK